MASTTPPAQSDRDEEDIFAEENGVPSIDQPFIQKYLDGRDALIAQEKLQRSDHAFRSTLSPMAAEASTIVSAIRFEEQQTLWSRTYEDNLSKQEDYEVYPGMMFSLARERMEKSKLWKIVKKMPKGALLHTHFDALGDLDWLLEEALKTDGMCIAADGPLDSPAALKALMFHFQHNSAAFAEKTATSLWSSSYIPNALVPIHQAVATFDGGEAAFKNWLKSRLTISPHDSVSHHLGVDEIWRFFTSCFRILSSIHFYEPIFRKWVRGILQDLHSDGVRWVDIRHVFIAPYYRTGSNEPDEDFSGLLEAFDDEIEAFKSSKEGEGFWGARIIWTSLRIGGTRDIITDMQQCIEMKLDFPDLIAGYDFVGQEDLGRPLADLTPEIFWFKKACAQAGVDIPFFFHAGECLGSGDATDDNLFDAILLGTRRIGHGFSLYKHPLLIEMVKDKKILIESCPVSNEVLRLTSSILAHPLPALLARGVPCSLCNDDPLILGQGSSGMTHDFWQALQGWENLGLEGLANLAENSVRWATFEDCSAKQWQLEIKEGAFGKGVRAQRMREWAREFEEFCAWIVGEYGPEYDAGSLD